MGRDDQHQRGLMLSKAVITVGAVYDTHTFKEKTS